MKTCIISITEEGNKLGARLAGVLDTCVLLPPGQKVADAMHHAWPLYDGIICIMAAGIVVRSICPLVEDKEKDPCVVVLDQKGKHAISLLSGHLGGGNELAAKVAKITGGTAIITTASDIEGLTPLDLWAKRNSLAVTDRKKLTKISARQVNGSKVKIFSEQPLRILPDDLLACDSPENADIVISFKKHMTSSPLYCIPKVLYIGVGCNRGTPAEDIMSALNELLESADLEHTAIAGVASIDIKRDEQGIIDFSNRLGVELLFFSKDELNQVENVSVSPAAMIAVGVKGVAEPAALLAAGKDGSQSSLIIRKMKWKDVTLAVAERKKYSWE